MNTRTTMIAALATTALLAAAALLAPGANATTVTPTEGVVVAQQSLQALASAPRAITVITSPDTRVMISAPKTTSRSAITDDQGRITFTALNAGTTYTITADDDTTTAVPLVKVGRASGLTVTATERPDTVSVTWQHRATKARGGSAITYTITATPVTDAQQRTITAQSRTTSVELSGLDPRVVYSFAVTAHNALGAGQPSIARMSAPLTDIVGIADDSTDEDDFGDNGTDREVPQPHRTPNTSQPAAAPAAPTAAASSAPAPAPRPTTRTIWVCPDGYADAGSACTQSMAYTYSSQQETQPYTYRSETRTESCAGPDCPGSQYVNFGTDWTGGSCPNGGTLHGGQCLGWTGSSRQVTYQVKNAPPAGWSDDGSQYVRTVQVKDPAPAGWSDNGSEWIRTAAKVEQVVPA